MNYAEMSDQEINMAIANVYYSDFDVIESKSRYPSACVLGRNPNQWVDYCNNPEDAWPIIVENLISVEPDYEFIDPSEEKVFSTGLWIASYFDGKDFTIRHAHTSPLRAAIVVFLMMKEWEGK